MKQEINVKFKTLEGGNHFILFNPKLPILDLKKKISWELRVNEENLVIIFRGKKLLNDLKLTDYDFEEGKTLNVIARQSNLKNNEIESNKI